MISKEAVRTRVQIGLTAESLSKERIAYLESLVRQARTAAAVFTQFSQADVDRIVKAMVLAGLEHASIPVLSAKSPVEPKGPATGIPTLPTKEEKALPHMIS